MARVVGIGGVVQRAAQPERLRQWYAEHLGIDLSESGSAVFESESGAAMAWAILDADSDYFGRPDQTFMVNFRVDDLDALLTQLRAAGVEVIESSESYEYGRFAWAVDPEGTRFELWEPAPDS